MGWGCNFKKPRVAMQLSRNSLVGLLALDKHRDYSTKKQMTSIGAMRSQAAMSSRLKPNREGSLSGILTVAAGLLTTTASSTVAVQLFSTKQLRQCLTCCFLCSSTRRGARRNQFGVATSRNYSKYPQLTNTRATVIRK